MKFLEYLGALGVIAVAGYVAFGIVAWLLDYLCRRMD